MKIQYLMGIALGILCTTAFASGAENCKLTVRTYLKSGETKVDQIALTVSSREACKAEAKKRQTNKDKDVEQVKASYSFEE